MQIVREANAGDNESSNELVVGSAAQNVQQIKEAHLDALFDLIDVGGNGTVEVRLMKDSGTYIGMSCVQVSEIKDFVSRTEQSLRLWGPLVNPFRARFFSTPTPLWQLLRTRDM